MAVRTNIDVCTIGGVAFLPTITGAAMPAAVPRSRGNYLYRIMSSPIASYDIFVVYCIAYFLTVRYVLMSYIILSCRYRA